MNKTQDKTTVMPVFKSLFVSGQPEPRRRYPRDTASMAATMRLPVMP